MSAQASWTLQRHSGLSVAVALAIFSGAFALDAFVPETLNVKNGLRVRNGAIALPVMVSFLLFAHYYLNARWKALLRNFLERNTVAICYEDVALQLAAAVKKGTRLAVAFSLVVTSAYVITENLLRTDSSALELYLCFVALFFWGLIFLVIYELIFITQYVLRRLIHPECIDLFGINKLKYLSDLVIVNAVISAIGLCMVPLFWIGREVPVIDRVIVGVVFFLLLWFLFWPVTHIQTVIARKKEMAVSRINESIKALFNERKTMHRRLTDDPERLRHLSALISAKQEITSVAEWPVDFPQSVKTCAIVISVPASWVIGVIVENIIGTLNLL